MENQTKMQEAFDAGISLTKKAAERLSAVMEAEGKKRVWTKNESHNRRMFWHEL